MRHPLFCCWLLLVIFRFVWTLLPQSGYIHPDEFFQSIEIVTGDIFGVNVVRSWEFNTSSPVRSIVPLYMTLGPPLLLLRSIVHVVGESWLTWYTVTVAARGSVAVLSLIVDLSVYWLCRRQCQERDTSLAGMLLAATSYVTLVFYTRTFTNTTEAFLFAMLMYFTSAHRDHTSQVQQSKSSSFRSSKPEIRQHAGRQHSFDKLATPCIIVIGFFNRPTFVVYAVVPYLYWLLAGFTSIKLDAVRILKKCIVSLMTAAPLAAIFVICDSVYFGRLTLDLLAVVKEIQSHGLVLFLTWNLTATPLNFLRYNVRSDNLAEHGVHPRITHLVVNVPLLFGILGIFLASELIELVCRICRRLPVTDYRSMLLLSCAVPVLLLSLFPHQEPRFLIPLVIPLAALYSNIIFGADSSLKLRTVWIFFNILCGTFFGAFHQGGVVRALGYVQSVQSASVNNVRTDIIFWRTYMPPRHLLLQRLRYSETIDLNSSDDDECHGVRLLDVAGQPLETVIEHLLMIRNVNAKCLNTNNVELVAPGSLHRKLSCSLARGGFRVELRKSFWPHFTSEDLPSVDGVMCREYLDCDVDVNICLTSSLSDRIVSALSLNLYTIIYN